MALIRNASFGAPRLRSVLYATFSSAQAITAPTTAPDSMPAMIVRGIATPLRCRLPRMPLTTRKLPNAPDMNTSLCAKLINCRTPYTRV